MSHLNVKEIGEEVCLNTETMARIFSVSPDTISNWEKKGCPKEARGWWSIRKVIKWKLEGVEDKAKGGEKSSLAIKTDFEAKLKEAKFIEQDYKNKITKGEYLAKDQIIQELQEFFLVFKKSCTVLSRTIAMEMMAYVGTKEARKIESLVKVVLDDALEQMSVDGVYEQKKKKTK